MWKQSGAQPGASSSGRPMGRGPALAEASTLPTPGLRRWECREFFKKLKKKKKKKQEQEKLGEKYI